MVCPKLTFDKEINTARSQVLFVTTARKSESKSSQGLSQLPGPSQTRVPQAEEFEGRSQVR